MPSFAWLRASGKSTVRRPERTNTRCAGPASSDACSARAKRESARGRWARSELVHSSRLTSTGETLASRRKQASGARRRPTRRRPSDAWTGAVSPSLPAQRMQERHRLLSRAAGGPQFVHPGCLMLDWRDARNHARGGARRVGGLTPPGHDPRGGRAGTSVNSGRRLAAFRAEQSRRFGWRHRRSCRPRRCACRAPGKQTLPCPAVPTRRRVSPARAWAPAAPARTSVA
jgi:hypothetical protein